MASPLDRPENVGPLQYLAHGRAATEATFGPPPPDVDRWHLGTHPDVVDWLWDTLNSELPKDGRWLIYDGPALVQPTSGVILAAGIGTQYALRLLPEHAAAAIGAGAELVHEFRTVGTMLDLPATFGPGWVFGHFAKAEGEWLRASYLAHAT